MASNRQYAYYLRGNQIAIVEEGLGTGVCSLSGYSNQTTCEAAGGTWTENATGSDDGEYRSPTATVADGLEIEYAYSPRYQLYSSPIVDVNKFYVNGWMVKNGYLTFLRAQIQGGATDWTSSPESVVTSGSAGHTGGDTSDYIVVTGSSRWNGLHKVQTAGTQGLLTTYTKVSSSDIYWEGVDVDMAADETIYDGGGSSNIFLADHFSTGDYIFLNCNSQQPNEGLWKISAATKAIADTESKLTVGNHYLVPESDQAMGGDYTDHPGINNEYETSVGFNSFADNGSNAVNIYKVHREFCAIHTDVDTLNDESDTIDLPEYLTKALVHYVKSQLAEDQGDLAKYQYHRKQFRALMQRYESSRSWGSRRVFPGIGAIR